MDKWTDNPEDRTVDAITRRYKVCRKRTEALCKKHGGDDFSEPLPDDVYRRVCDDIEYLTIPKKLKVLGGKVGESGEVEVTFEKEKLVVKAAKEKKVKAPQILD